MDGFCSKYHVILFLTVTLTVMFVDTLQSLGSVQRLVFLFRGLDYDCDLDLHVCRYILPVQRSLDSVQYFVFSICKGVGVG
jgi:hypothetical protein